MYEKERERELKKRFPQSIVETKTKRKREKMNIG